jgi:hypothetical protein
MNRRIIMQYNDNELSLEVSVEVNQLYKKETGNDLLYYSNYNTTQRKAVSWEKFCGYLRWLESQVSIKYNDKL